MSDTDSSECESDSEVQNSEKKKSKRQSTAAKVWSCSIAYNIVSKLMVIEFFRLIIFHMSDG